MLVGARRGEGYDSGMNQAVREGKDWVERMARAGYASKGAVYVLVGVLAFMAAFGLGGSISGPKEALQSLQPKTFGEVLLGVAALGLFCYAVWRLVQAFYDADGKGNDAKALAVRSGYAISGVIHLSLAWAVAQMILGGGGSGSTSSEDGLTARLMGQPFGVWLVGAVGVVIAIIAGYQIYRAVSGGFKKRLNLSEASGRVRDLLCRTCQFGLVARGVTFGIIAWFFLRAAVNYNPEEAGGLPEALGTIAAREYGPWLLGLMGLGLAAYGVYAFVEARFRRIRV